MIVYFYGQIMLKLKKIDHITVTFPKGKDDDAYYFYKNILGLEEIPNLVANAFWFKMGDIDIHVYREDLASPLSSRHSAFEVDDLNNTKAFLENCGIDIQYSSKIEGRERLFFRDPFGNRFELIEYI